MRDAKKTRDSLRSRYRKDDEKQYRRLSYFHTSDQHASWNGTNRRGLAAYTAELNAFSIVEMVEMATCGALLDSHTRSLASLRGNVVMIHSDPELLNVTSGRCRDDAPNEPHQTLQPTSRFRSSED